LKRLFQKNTEWGKRLQIAIAVVLFFSLFGYWKFQEPLTKHEVSLAPSGDGLAWIGIIYTLDQEVRENGIGVLWGETLWSEKLGFDITAPYPLNAYWKLKFWILSRLFSVEKVYELIAILAFVLIGTFGFLLFREMEVSIFFALAGALFLTHMDHFFLRLSYSGHMVGVGSYYLPILLAWGTIRAGKCPSMWRLVVLSLLNTFNLLVFEYYGYFGLFFSCGLFIGYLIKCKGQLEIRKVALRCLIAVVVFITLMSLCYPDLVFNKITSLLFTSEDIPTAIHNQKHSWGTFLHGSVKHPLAIFDSLLPWVGDLMNHDLFKKDGPAFTFRIGVILPVFAFLSFVYFGFQYIFRRERSDLDYALDFCIWMIPTLFVCLLALNPTEYSFSLLPLSYRVAPMLRSSGRAFLYADLAIIVLFILFSDKLARDALAVIKGQASSFHRAQGVLALLFVLSVVGLGLLDVASGRLFKKVNGRELPDARVYEVLNGKPEGLVLELPVLSPITDSQEKTYAYFYNRTKHGFPIANIWYPGPSNQEFSRTLDSHAKYLNELSPEAIDDLKTTGVRYIAVDKMKVDDTNLRESSQARLITETCEKSIFEIIVDEDFGTEDFPEHFLYNKPTFLFGNGFHVYEERKENIYWRWAGKTGELYLVNHSKKDMRIMLKTGISAPKGSKIRIESEAFSDTIQMTSRRVEYERVIDLKSKSAFKLTFILDKEPKKAGAHKLGFNLFNYKMHAVSESMSQKLD